MFTPELKVGAGAGVLAGLLDVGLIAAADPAASSWVGLQSFLFWAGAGWVVVASRSGLPPLLHGVLVTMLLNLPWFIALGPGSGHLAHVPPLVLMSVVFGAGFGWARGKVAR